MFFLNQLAFNNVKSLNDPHCTIRDYEPGDYSQIVDLWDVTGLGGAVRGDNQAVIEHSLGLGGKMLVAVLPDGRLIGSSWMTYDGRRLHLHHFGIVPQYQRRGIGLKLAEASVAYARERRIQIKLEVHRNNHAAIALYTTLGFTYLGDYDIYIIRE